MNVRLRKERDDSSSTRDEETNDCKEQPKREIVSERSGSREWEDRTKACLYKMIRRPDTFSCSRFMWGTIALALFRSCRVTEGSSPDEGPEIMVKNPLVRVAESQLFWRLFWQ